MAQVEAHLLAQEARIEQATQKLNSSPLQAHVANRDSNVASGDLSGSVHSQAPQMFSGYRGGYGGRGFRGCGGRSSEQNSLTCQLCHKTGHTSFNCWHRFDQNFTPSPPPPPPYAHFTTTYPPHYISQPPPSPAYPSFYVTAPARVLSPAPSHFSHSTSMATPDSVVDAA